MDCFPASVSKYPGVIWIICFLVMADFIAEASVDDERMPDFCWICE